MSVTIPATGQNDHVLTRWASRAGGTNSIPAVSLLDCKDIKQCVCVCVCVCVCGGEGECEELKIIVVLRAWDTA